MAIVKETESHIVESTLSTGGVAVDMALALELSGLLDRHYPGYQWGVHVNSSGGVVDIKNLAVSGEYGYRLLLSKVFADISRKCVINAGGEILERARLVRGKYKHDVEEIVDGIKPTKQPILKSNPGKFLNWYRSWKK